MGLDKEEQAMFLTTTKTFGSPFIVKYFANTSVEKAQSGFLSK